jgi:hypothetical protein
MNGTWIRRAIGLYTDGFRNLSSWGRSVWIIILIKLFILFAIIRVFFMPDILKKNFKTDEDRSNHVLENLTGPKTEVQVPFSPGSAIPLKTKR